MSKNELKQRLEHDENFILKVGSEVGDLCKIIRNQQAQMEKLKRRIEKLEQK